MRAFSSIYQSQVKNFNKEHKRQKTRLSKNSVYNLVRWRGHIMFVGSYSCTRYKHTHKPQFLHSHWRRVRCSKRPLLNSLRWLIYVINLADNSKLTCYTLLLVSFVLLILTTVLFLCHNREVLWPKETSINPHFEKYLGKIPRWRTNLKGMNDDASLSIASDQQKLVQSTRFKRARLRLHFCRIN